MDIDVDPVSPDILSQHPVTPTQPNKQKRPIVHDNTLIRPNPFVFTQTKKSEIERKILEARDLILGASVIAKGTPEQNDLLDLLEIFREYTEKKKVRQTSSILAKQINNLEKATKKSSNNPVRTLPLRDKARQKNWITPSNPRGPLYKRRSRRRKNQFLKRELL